MKKIDENISIIKTTDVFWKDYRNLRLRALKKEPQAFASTYKSQKNDGDEKWQQRLKLYQDGKGDWMVFSGNGRNLIGMSGAFQTDEDRKDNEVYIIAVYVVKKARGKGVSKLLLKSLLEELIDAGVRKVKLSVSSEQIAAVKLYENFGFKTIGKENVILGDGKYHKVLLMGKFLY